MAITDFESTPWLLGAIGTPVIPPSWARDALWVACLSMPDAGPSAMEPAITAWQLASKPWVKIGKNTLDIEVTAARIGLAASESDSNWLDRTVSDQVFPEDAVAGDLPLMTSTFSALAALRMERSAPIRDIAPLPRRVFADLDRGWLALLDLSITLECWWTHRSASPIWQSLKSARTLEGVAEALIKEYLTLDGQRQDERWVGFIMRRQSWGMPKATLDEIGIECGVTRERVRQVIVRIERLVGARQWPLHPVVTEIVEELRKNEFRNVEQVLVDSGFTTDDDWTPEELVLLLQWLGYRDLANALQSRFDDASEEFGDPRLAKAIRAARGKTGVFRLDAVAYEDGTQVPSGLALDAARSMYSRVYESSGWLLTGDVRPTAMENGVSRQLAVTDPMTPSDLYDGLVRIQKMRGETQIPHVELLLDLLKQSGAITDVDGQLSGVPSPPEPGSINDWLVTLLRNADGHVLHKELLNRAAIRDRVNISSLGVFYLYSPLIRPCGDRLGLITLAGCHPSESDMTHAISVAEATRVATQFNWLASTRGIDLEITLGSNLVGTGVLGSANVGLCRQWPEGGASISCTCSRMFKGRISVANGNALIGWSPLLHHLLLEHDAGEGSTLSLSLQGERLLLLNLA